MRWPARSLPLLLLLLPLATCSLGEAGNEGNGGDECELGALPFHDVLAQRGDTRHVHDPVVVRDDDQYVLFSTGHGIPIRRSEDLVRWTLTGETVFDGDVPSWAASEVPGVAFPWAPDISFFNDRYHLYYSLSTFGSQQSVIGLATTPTLDPAHPDYAWTDRGKVVESHQGDDYNAIDPNVAFDGDDRPWLMWGSHWGGIRMHRLDAETGLLHEDDTDLHSLAARPDEDAVEAPFIVRHDGYYYLFVSFDQCCEGTASTYKIVVGRAEDITGPYVDRDGTPMMEGGGTLVLAGYGRIRGPGHNAVLSDDGRHYLVHHFYDADDSEEAGVPRLQVRLLLWGPEGWPLAGAPYDGTDSIASEGDAPALAGRWSHSVDFASPAEIRLTDDGRIEQCDGEGAWSLDEASLVLHWSSEDGSDGECRCMVAADGTWYVGRDQDGRIVRGWNVDDE